MALTTAEAAKVAGVSARTIRRWIERGTLPAVAGAGGALYVFPHDLEAARITTRNRPARVGREARDAPQPGTPGDRGRGRDDRDDRDTSLVPDPAGEAAGAVLVAWRDTVLAPVVEQLANVTRELGDAREAVGRLEAERDAANRERDELRRRVAEVEAEHREHVLASRQDAPGAAAGADAAAGPFVAGPPAWRRFPETESPPAVPRRPWWRRLLGRP